MHSSLKNISTTILEEYLIPRLLKLVYQKGTNITCRIDRERPILEVSPLHARIKMYKCRRKLTEDKHENNNNKTLHHYISNTPEASRLAPVGSRK